ncbi:MAG: IclR family transcriptional regulator [Dethiosulfatibacter sp.]|nr:IclR family transcriptional regulator [Dethiosulfatibacter sp.]
MEEKLSITKSIERSFKVLESFLNGNSELSMTEIKELSGLPQSTAHRIIATLEEQDYLERNLDNKKYYLGTKIIQLGASGIKYYKLNTRRIALPYMIKLRDKFSESVTLFTVHEKYRICIERVEPERGLRTVMSIGEKLSIRNGASGKMLMAYMSDDYLEKILDDFDEELRLKLKKVKEQGYAISIGERDESLIAIAAPVFESNGEVLGALSLAGPTDRFYKEKMEEKISEVVKICDEISQTLGYRKK